jgi:hypothetical protein
MVLNAPTALFVMLPWCGRSTTPADLAAQVPFCRAAACVLLLPILDRFSDRTGRTRRTR